MDPLGAPTGSGRHTHGEAAWDLDVDAFLDDYLKEMGPEGEDLLAGFATCPDALGTFAGLLPGLHAEPASSSHLAAFVDASELDNATSMPSGMDVGAAPAPPVAPQRTQPTRKAGGRMRGGAAAQAAAATASDELDVRSSKKHQALQEKNRRAQRRFRERQKQKVSELEDQVAELSSQLQAALGRKVGLEARCAALERVPAASAVASAPAAPPPAAGALAPAELAAVCEEGLTLTARALGAPTTLAPDALRALPEADFCRYYRAYVHEMAACVVETGDKSRLAALVDEVCALCFRVALVNPPAMKSLMVCKVDSTSNARPADERVPAVLRAMHLTAEQRAELRQLRCIFLQKLAAILAERRAAAGLAAASVPATCGGLRSMAQQFLAAGGADTRFRASMHDEHMLVLDFSSTCLKHVFTLQQVAQFAINSYPWTPDCLALATWAAAEDGDAEALGVLATEAQTKAAALARGGGGSAGSAPSAPSSLAGTWAASVQPGLEGLVPLFAMPGLAGAGQAMQLNSMQQQVPAYHSSGANPAPSAPPGVKFESSTDRCSSGGSLGSAVHGLSKPGADGCTDETDNGSGTPAPLPTLAGCAPMDTAAPAPALHGAYVATGR